MTAVKQNRSDVGSRLEKLLDHEYTLYEGYLELLKQEESHIVKFDTEAVNKLTLKRAELCEGMRAAHAERLELMGAFPECKGERLRKMALRCFHPQEAKRIISRADKLEALARETTREGIKHKQILSFGLKCVNGLVSMFWSATQNVVKSYSRKGKTKESYHPANSRKQNVIKEA